MPKPSRSHVALSRRAQKSIRALPTPTDYFSGAPGLLASAPSDALVFHRAAEKDAMMEGVQMHPRFVLCVCLEKAAVMTVDGRMLPLGEGQGLLLFPFQQHTFSSFEGKKISWLFVSFDATGADSLAVLRNTPFVFTRRSWVYLGRIVEAFQDWLEEEDSRAVDISPWIALLMGELVRNPRNYLVGSSLKKHTELHARHAQIRDAVRYVYEHLDKDLDLGDVAGQVHMSVSHFSRIFREEMRMSPGEFMLQARINHASALLHTTDFNMTEIAERCGFGTPYSFSRAFKQQTGTPPSEFRENLAETAG